MIPFFVYLLLASSCLAPPANSSDKLNLESTPVRDHSPLCGSVLENTSFSDLPASARKEWLLCELKKQNVPQPEFWLRVAIQESGHNLGSTLALRTNNCFGMARPLKRPTTSKEKIGTYAEYDSIEDCVMDIKLWCEYTGFNNSTDPYQHLKNKLWNPNPDLYIKSLKRIQL